MTWQRLALVWWPSSVQDLQLLINRVSTAGMKYVHIIIKKKTKFMIVGHETHPDAKIRIIGREINWKVREFKYLGFIITEDLILEVEVKCRITYAKAAFMKMKNLLTNQSPNLNFRQRTLKCYINSILLYSAEVATYAAKTINYLKACKMDFIGGCYISCWLRK